MRQLTLQAFQEIRTWIYRNARPLELAQWQYSFEGGGQEAVLTALSFYQNDDGGFGHALEADNWNPHSSPYTTLRAIHILKGIDFIEKQHPLMKGIMKFLGSHSFSSERGWDFSIPSNDGYPHAPWWTYNSETNAVEGMGVTAEIAGFLLKHAEKDSKLFHRALNLSDSIICKLRTSGSLGDMGIGSCCALLESIEHAKLDWRFDCRFLKERLIGLVHGSIERDPSQWVRYSVRPSEYISSPASLFYEGNEDIVVQELEYLLETRPQHGVWNITWSWFDNNERYAKEFAISENWWKASKSMEKLLFLRNFGRVDHRVFHGV